MRLAFIIALAAGAPEDAARKAPALSPLLAEPGGALITTREAWARRRDELRKRWLDFLGELPAKRVPLDARVLGTTFSWP